MNNKKVVLRAAHTHTRPPQDPPFVLNSRPVPIRPNIKINLEAFTIIKHSYIIKVINLMKC